MLEYGADGADRAGEYCYPRMDTRILAQYDLLLH